MKRHVFGTFLLGATITWLAAYGIYIAGFENLAYLMAAFFGAVTGVATVTDYLEQKDRQKYDELVLPEGPVAVHVGSFVAEDGEVREVHGLQDAPPEIRDAILGIIRTIENQGGEISEVKVGPIPGQRKPALSSEELDEIEEKFS